MPVTLSRKIYADMYGPTTGDKVRLADTELFIEVEEDLTSYGDEVKFGGGKVIRDGMGQSQISRDGGAVDTVITNALIVDVTGIYKADIGLKNGLIEAIGKAGNPDTQDDVNIINGVVEKADGTFLEGYFFNQLYEGGDFKDIVLGPYPLYEVDVDRLVSKGKINAVLNL